MDRYFTVMLIPEKEKGVRSFRIPRIIFHALVFFVVIFVTILGILTYDYLKILRQVYENKHLTIENRQLKEQIQLFSMKLNTLSEDLERVQIFEKKLRIITGIEEANMSKSISPKKNSLQIDDEKLQSPSLNPTTSPSSTLEKYKEKSQSYRQELFKNLEDLKKFKTAKKYQRTKALYEKKIATSFGLLKGYRYTKEWSELTKQSFSLASRFAEFDFKYSTIKNYVKDLEISIHELDQFLLDKESFLKSTPTLLPTKGWITSYYGPRISPTSNRLRMHEGLDIGGRPGTPIVAPADGRVAFAGIKPGFGKFVQLDHGYGVESFFAHARKLYVKKGQVISRGHLIAALGNTGSSTGPHVHYEIRVNGTPVDPLFYILN